MLENMRYITLFIITKTRKTESAYNVSHRKSIIRMVFEHNIETSHLIHRLQLMVFASYLVIKIVKNII